ncbi:MAG: ABC transporter ATP-binding protein [Planctomycetota bacterium]
MQVKGLRKSFGDTLALRGVGFSVGEGERIALLGPNGAGKTTLIRCLCGRVKPDEGEITLMGQTLSPTANRNQLGLVPQDIALYEDLSTIENLRMFGRFHGLRGRDLHDRVQWALKWTGLDGRSHDLVGGFSGGMKRRVNLACGVLHRPAILLLDEPTVGVDPQSRERIFCMLDELHAGGTAIVLTTHHLDEAQTRTDRIVIVDHGRIVADGSLQDLIDGSVGNRRRVDVRYQGQLQQAPPGWTPGTEPTSLVCRIDDVVDGLPVMLQRVRAVGGTITDVQVQSPSLHDVFLHLTGHDLRDE